MLRTVLFWTNKTTIFINRPGCIQSDLSYSGCSNRFHPDEMMCSSFLRFFIFMSFTLGWFYPGKAFICWLQEKSKTDKDVKANVTRSKYQYLHF